MSKFFVFLLVSSSIFATGFTPPRESNSELTSPSDTNEMTPTKMLGKRPISDLYTFEVLDSCSHEIEAPLRDDNVDNGLVYIPVEDDEVEMYLELLANLSGKNSTDVDGALRSEGERRVFFEKVQKTSVRDFIPLIKLLIRLVEVTLSVDEQLSHCAIRIDPDMKQIRRNRNRAASCTWHAHDRDAYLFTLTTDENLTTLIKIGNNEFNIHKNQLFLLRNGMTHKTPRPQSGKRIHISIGIDKMSTHTLSSRQQADD